MHLNPWGFMDYKATKNLHSKIYFFYLRRQIMFEDFVDVKNTNLCLIKKSLYCNISLLMFEMHSMTNICHSMSISMDLHLYFSLTFLSGKARLLKGAVFV